MTFAIVVVGYNRPAEMMRLLKSICDADYTSIFVDLIISLDFSDKQADLIAIAERITWTHGKKEVRVFGERQGLRKHVLQCGDLTEKYDAVIVLEDDIVVAKGFMHYVIATVKKYNNDSSIAGISLYTHRRNPGNGRSFEAQNNGYDAFMMQYAQSWGQCWTRSMWAGFRQWYEKQSEHLFGDEKFPEYVASWDNRSWLKYYIKYTVETDKYHIYPYFSLSTNCSAAGEHSNAASSAYQVPLQESIIDEYRLPTVSDAVKYDAFFERKFDEKLLQSFMRKPHDRVTLDLYGLRNEIAKGILISIKSLPYKVINEIGLLYRPIEQNIIYGKNGRTGSGIYVYDTREAATPPQKNTDNVLEYEFKDVSTKLILKYGFHRIKKALTARLLPHSLRLIF